MKRRLGRFSVSRAVVEEHPEECKLLFQNCIVVRCELMFDGGFEYMAISDDFDEIDSGAATPYYAPILEKNDGVVSFKGWQKIQ